MSKKEEKAEEEKVEEPEEVEGEKAPGEAEEAEETEGEEEPEERPEEEEEHYEGAVNRGDFILLEMTGRSEETGEVFETTDEEAARENELYSDEKVYGPRLVVVGEGWVLRGLDKRLPGLKEGEGAEIEIPSDEAFGERNPNNVQMMPYRVLRSKGINPVVGAELEIDGRNAVIRSVGAGRVQVDYNHPLAGNKIVYDVRVDKLIEDDLEKIRALIGRRFIGVETGKFGVKKLKRKVRIEVPEEAFFGENIQLAKRGVALDILRFFPEPEEVEFVEVVKRTG